MSYSQILECDVELKQTELRDCSQFAQQTKTACRRKACNFSFRADSNEERGFYFALIYIVPIVIALRIGPREKYSDFINGKDSSPLIEVFATCAIADWAIAHLRHEPAALGNDEYTAEQRIGALQLAFNAIFATKYNEKAPFKKVGMLTFNKETKERILAVAGLLTDAAEYNT